MTPEVLDVVSRLTNNERWYYDTHYNAELVAVMKLSLCYLVRTNEGDFHVNREGTRFASGRYFDVHKGDYQRIPPPTFEGTP